MSDTVELDFEPPACAAGAPIKLVIIMGLVVPAGTIVRKGSNYSLNIPSLEKTQASFKQLMGIKKKRVVVADDESEASFKAKDSSDEESEASDASEASEVVESDND